METEEKKKLTDNQLRVIQAIAGIISAAALIVSIHVGTLQSSQSNILLQYLFVIVFLVILFTRRKIESKFRLRLNFYNLVLIDGILAGILFYFLAFSNDSGVGLQMSVTAKIIVAVVLVLIIAILGILLPVLKYLKRKNNGTLIPIRIPEEKEEDKENVSAKPPVNSVSAKISEMTKDIDENNIDASSSNLIERRIAEMTKDLGEREITDSDENYESDSSVNQDTDSTDEAVDESVDSSVDSEEDDK